MRVLLAEDSASLRLLYEVWLAVDGYEVTSCADGRAALAALEATGAPDAAVLDVSMPLVDGIEVCRTLRTLEPEAVILVQTALDGMRAKALAAGADLVLEKPLTHEQLLKPLADLLRGSGGGRIRTSVG